jgi:hypothetical protein
MVCGERKGIVKVVDSTTCEWDEDESGHLISVM